MNPVLFDVEWNHPKMEASSYKGGDALFNNLASVISYFIYLFNFILFKARK